MKTKLGNMTHSEWLRHNEKLERKQNQKRRQVICTKIRFKDADNERRKIYRRATARLIARMSNNLLTLFHGTYIQKAKCRIVCHTSIGTTVILQRNRRFGDFKVVNQKFENLTLRQTEIEWKECLATFKTIFPERIEKVIDENTLPQDLPSHMIKHCKNIKSTFKKIEFCPMGGKTQSIESNSYSPIYEDKGKDKIGNDIELNFKKVNECIENQKEKISLPSAKDFQFINPNGSEKSFKVINQIK